MIIKDFIFTYYTLLTVLEYMYMMISSTHTHMYSIVPVTNMYISYSKEAECHTIFNGSGFFTWLDELAPYALGVIILIYLVEKCEVDLPTLLAGRSTGVPG